MRVSLVVVVLLVGLITACGRSAEAQVACPQPADACDDVLAQQHDVEAIFADAVNADDAARADEASDCTQLLVEVSLDKVCVDTCAELCRLHPCFGAPDEAGVRASPDDCAARCANLKEAGTVDDAALAVATQKASEAPGFCTCRACTAADDALCTQLFDCAVP